MFLSASFVCALYALTLMDNNMKTKKGFSLVELAIVLVVIGILMGLAIKGKSLIDAANLKADINKIARIQMAVNTYFTKYDRLPGMPSGGTATLTDKIVYDALVDEELLKYNDMVISDGSYGDISYWHFTGCSYNVDGYLVSQSITSGNRLCIFVGSVEPGNMTSTAPATNPRSKESYICSIETMIDDYNVRAGNGRLTSNVTAGVGATNFKCNDPAIADNLVGYLYRVR